jgi:hypothetical protein
MIPLSNPTWSKYGDNPDLTDADPLLKTRVYGANRNRKYRGQQKIIKE